MTWQERREEGVTAWPRRATSGEEGGQTLVPGAWGHIAPD